MVDIRTYCDESLTRLDTHTRGLIAQAFCLTFSQSRWGEDPVFDEVLAHFGDDTALEDTHPMVVTATENTNDEVVGFAWGFRAEMGIIVPHIVEVLTSRYPEYVEEDMVGNNLSMADNLEFDPPYFYVSEFGVVPRYRKTFTPEFLDNFCTACIEMGSCSHISWMNRQRSGVYPHVMRAGAREIYDFGRDTVLVAGELNKLVSYAKKANNPS